MRKVWNPVSSWVANLHRDWNDLRHSRPGHRFQDRYDHAARHRGRHAWLGRVLKIAGGILLMLIGIAEMVFPGPAIVFFAIGGALLATQSRAVAKVMDRAELRLRHGLRLARDFWRKASWGSRAAVVIAAVAIMAAGGYAAYRVFWK